MATIKVDYLFSTNQHAYDEGIQAFINGLFKDNNPYSRQLMLHDAWEEGFQDGLLIPAYRKSRQYNNLYRNY